MLLAALIAVSVGLAFYLAASHDFGAGAPREPVDDPFEPEHGVIGVAVGCPPSLPPRPPCSICAAAKEVGACVHDRNGKAPGEEGFSLARLAPVALLVLGLLAPGVAHADVGGAAETAAVGGLGSLIMLGALTLIHTTGLDVKFASWIASIKAPSVNIANHPRISAGITALEQAALHIVQDMITPALLADLEAQLKTKSLSAVGAYMLSTYSPKLLVDLEAQAKILAGEELDVLFGDSALKAQTAELKLGEAASQVVATAKAIKLAPSGRPIVVAAETVNVTPAAAS